MLIAALAGLLVGRQVWYRRPVPPLPQVVRPPIAADARGATLVLRHQGQKQAEVYAGRVEVSRDLRFTTFKGGPRATLYDRERVALRVSADEIVLDRQSNDLRARGHLILTSPEGFRLTAPEVMWVAARQQLIFPSGVEVRTSDTVIQAARLVVDLGLQSLDLEGGVDITFRVAGGIP